MSCLNLRLPPAKKAWKSFTSKLQSKLHKLSMSKSIKKSKYRTNSITTTTYAKAVRPHVLFDKKRDENRKRLAYQPRTLPFKQRGSRFGHVHKKSAPVYIDKLFREPVSSSELVAKFPPTAKTVKILDHQAATIVVPEGTSREDEMIRRGERGFTADDMWESLGFASPQMHGIDERAEQFILTFRAEMEIQETIARGL